MNEQMYQWLIKWKKNSDNVISHILLHQKNEVYSDFLETNELIEEFIEHQEVYNKDSTSFVKKE